MKKRWFVLQWLALALMFVAPTLWRYESSSAMTWLCTKDSVTTPRREFQNVCLGEPTLYHRLGFSDRWDAEDQDYPRTESMPIVSLDDLDEASVWSEQPHVMSIMTSNTCWKHHPPGHSWCWGAGFGFLHLSTTLDPSTSDFETAAIAASFNSFRKDPHQRTFRVPRPRPVMWWHYAVYAIATLLAIVSVRRAGTAPTRAWLAAVEAIPATPRRSPYRD